MKKHSDDEVPSIAIIPFENKGAEEDVFYAYGISADLISDVTVQANQGCYIDKINLHTCLMIGTKILVRYIANGELWKWAICSMLSIELYDTKIRRLMV